MMYLSKDKKLSALSSLDMIIVNDIGNVEIETKSFDEILSALEANKDELKKFTI